MLIDDLFDESFIDPEVEDYINFLEADEQDNTGFLTKKRVNEHFQECGEMLNLFMVYPDRFVDLIIPHNSHFKLFFFQRLMIRCIARGNATFETFSRGTSKSFIADLERYLHCMFIPRHNTTITAGTNKQAAEIAKQKVVDDLWVKFPLLANEMQKRKVAGKILDAYKMGKDYVEFNFKNGSSLGLGNVRGLRRQSLIFEEVIEQDEVKVNEVYIPLLNEPRKMYNGLINPYEPQSQQIYITTAGYQNTFAYQKLIEILCRSVLEPEKYFVLSGSYRIPLSCGLTAQKQIEDVINSPSFSKSSFEREYESRWSDAPMGAAFSSNVITSLRQVKVVELKDKRTPEQIENDCFYVICADMAKDGAADTAVGVAKIIPKEHYFTYKFINLLTIPSTDYMVVANTFKKLVLTYNAKLLVYDANGVGAGLRDWLNKQTTDEYGNILEGLGIINPPSTSERDLIKYPKDKTIIYEIKSGGRIGEQIHFFFFSRMSTGAITFPIKLSEALNLYSKNKGFVKMSIRKQQEYLLPFKVMDLMEAELKNLDIVNTSDQMSNTMKIIRRSESIQKDFFSMAEYLV
ncbi:MAG: hypothetical protein MR841_09510 [Lactobacillus johnsonii]|nr:hypothetical protein [Lactobacillus johnsonii]